jgi:hypothetical protein
LFSRFGGIYQRSHEGCIIADAVGRHFTRDCLRIARRLRNKVLDTIVKAVEMMMDDPVFGLNRGKSVGWLFQRAMYSHFIAHFINVHRQQFEACAQHFTT